MTDAQGAGDGPRAASAVPLTANRTSGADGAQTAACTHAASTPASSRGFVPSRRVRGQGKIDARAAAQAAYECVAPASTLLGLGLGFGTARGDPKGIANNGARPRQSASPWDPRAARDACRFAFYVLDVAYVSILYFVAGSLASVAINRIMPPLNTTQPLWKTTGEVVAEVILTGVTVSIIINIISSIPSPFGLGLCGYDHSKLRELFGGVIIAFSIYFFQADLLGVKMRFLRNGIIEPRMLRD